MGAEEWTGISLLVHVPVAVAWSALVGIEAFLCARSDVGGGQRMRAIAAMRWPTLALLLVILVTGIWQTIYNPFLVVTSFATLEELKNTTAYGTALFWKHVFVVGTVVFAVVTRFVLAPRAVAAGVDAPSGPMRGLVWLNVLACVLVLMATSRMTITLH